MPETDPTYGPAEKCLSGIYALAHAFDLSLHVPNDGPTARDHLSSERNFLAWLRLALTLTMVGAYSGWMSGRAGGSGLFHSPRPPSALRSTAPAEPHTTSSRQTDWAHFCRARLPLFRHGNIWLLQKPAWPARASIPYRRGVEWVLDGRDCVRVCVFSFCVGADR
ncbi:hypothetical protein BC938DRAFT_473353 [Jimgerdemannia flammicorona]|uniref:DUF202 domain-containing protein n=1 Tax=Jimgerdemannia flammicorona TaxID=994334 RepID=A0A433QTC5_9FUNG|nr:hypothetical protein BC938DRAFT_473353 [Jimgerdemannia flammicorona]